ncbi:arsenite methyltransferase protein [Rutstroemia sp. NJR-2017a BBW]|nr:arsenite methyltransferase protein [Rutstroemia sp. NJR-2017a BBW]
MAQKDLPSYYTRGHSDHTISTHLLRTAESHAPFLLPHLKPTDHILDVGCGPGTITTSFAKYVTEGRITGIDISPIVLQKAQTLASEFHIPTHGCGSVVFEEGDILAGLSYPDATFDVIYSSQLLGHMPPPELPLQALIEMRRVLKPGGILATRDGLGPHFYPRSLDLDRLWGQNEFRASRKGQPEVDTTAMSMPALFRAAGFKEIKVDAGTNVYAGIEDRKRMFERAKGQLRDGDAFYRSWVDAGITREEIQETLWAVEKWAGMEDAWMVVLQCDVLGWK